MRKAIITAILFFLVCNSSNAQKGKRYPNGISVDPDIEKTIRKMKDVNEFSPLLYKNDTLADDGMMSALAAMMPYTSVVNIAKGDTTLMLMNMLTASGFEITFHSDSIRTEYFVSSKDCKCFKSKLNDAALSYGAGSEPTQLTLVLNKRTGFQIGETIYGYIKMSGGGFYYFPNESSTYEKQSYNYEGYFKAAFQPLDIK